MEEAIECRQCDANNGRDGYGPGRLQMMGRIAS